MHWYCYSLIFKEFIILKTYIHRPTFFIQFSMHISAAKYISGCGKSNFHVVNAQDVNTVADTPSTIAPILSVNFMNNEQIFGLKILIMFELF